MCLCAHLLFSQHLVLLFLCRSLARYRVLKLNQCDSHTKEKKKRIKELWLKTSSAIWCFITIRFITLGHLDEWLEIDTQRNGKTHMHTHRETTAPSAPFALKAKLQAGNSSKGGKKWFFLLLVTNQSALILQLFFLLMSFKTILSHFRVIRFGIKKFITSKFRLDINRQAGENSFFFFLLKSHLYIYCRVMIALRLLPPSLSFSLSFFC